MAKGDYPTGALVEVLREYKGSGGSVEVYEQAKQELKHLLMCLVKLEAAQQSVQPTIESGREIPADVVKSERVLPAKSG